MNGDFLAPLIPIVAIVAFAMVRIAKIRAQAMIGGDQQGAQRLDAVEQDLYALRQELSEAQERIDFAERLLSQQKNDRLE